MRAILSVRISSPLPADELVRRMNARAADFAAVPGLVQKSFGLDPLSGDICGIYIFETRAALEAYRASPLATSIPAAYAATGIRREIFALLNLVHAQCAGAPRAEPS